MRKSNHKEKRSAKELKLNLKVVTKLTSLHLLAELGHIVWPYGPEELNVVVAVVFSHLLCCGFVWSLKHKRGSTTMGTVISLSNSYTVL